MLASHALLLALASFPALAAGDQGGPANAPDVRQQEQGKPKPKDERRDLERYFDGIPDRGVGRLFWSHWEGMDPRERRQVGRLIDAFHRGPADFGSELLGGDLDAAGLRRWMRRLGPFLMDADPKTGRRDRPFRGPPPEVWDELTRRHPGQPEGYAGLGEASFDAGDYQTAAQAYHRAIELGDRSAENLTGRGLAAERLGDFEQANRDAAEALGHDPDDPVASSLLRLTQGRLSQVRLGLERPGLQPAAADSLGVAAGPPEAGAPQAQAPAPLGPQSARWSREAARRLELGDFAAAEEAATRAIALDGGNVEALNLRAIARDKRGDRQGAVADATLALKLAPGNVPILNTRSWSLSGLRRFDEALVDSSLAVARAPGHAASRATLARALGGAGKRDEMIDALREAARLDRRFEATLGQALQLPREEDTELLFQGALEPKAPRRRSPRLPRLLVLVLASLSGGTLVALGLLHILSPAWKERLTTTLRRGGARRASPGSDEAPTGPFWDRYTYRRLVASGGMGIVYEAQDKSLDRRVAVKKMRGEMREVAKEREAFLKEARVVAGLKHPGIVEIYAIADDGPDLFLVFEFVEGRTLQALVKERGRLALKDALPVFKDVCEAVDYAHARGVIHRDLKPSNIMVTPGGRAKVMDFGIARRAEEPRKVLLTTTVAGTPAYMAPELEQGLLCRESDVFSLGVCLYETLTGRLPYEGRMGALALQKLEGKFQPASRYAKGLPAAADTVIARALSPAPARRFGAAGSFYRELEQASL